MRRLIVLSDGWEFFKTEEDKGVSVTLPHTWNDVDGQDGGNDYYRGTCRYKKNLQRPHLEAGQEVWLEFQGAAHRAAVFLNGREICRHDGGYSTFRVRLDQLLEENELEVELDNGGNDTVYPQKADFTFYGGLYRPVRLIIVPASHFALDYYGTPGIKVTPAVDLEARVATVTVETWQQGAETVTMVVAGQTKAVAVCGDYARETFIIEHVHLWDGIEDPFLYSAKAILPSGDMVSTSFGCRRFHMDPEEGFFLNGRSYPLRGGARHQDRKGVGNALRPEHHREDMEIVLEMGCNTLRLAHYQHAQEFYDLCDEHGIIVWAEIPYITMQMKQGRDNTLSQMKELLIQCYNHPSIVVWGLSNEITAASAVNEDLLENHRLLHRLCHRMDATRPTVLANVFMLETDSPLLEIPDINSYNLYFGWYLGELSETDAFFDEYHRCYPKRVIGFSEYGADANVAYQTSRPEKGDYTETYQALYHQHMLEMIEKRPWLWATHLWNIFDFAADGRDEGGKHGENQKGLVTFDRKIKKDAFYLYKAYWNKKEPFVHIAGGRYVDRPEAVTEIKVYSNQEEVTLRIDGKDLETKKGKYVFTFSVPLTGEHSIQASAGDSRSVIWIRRVSEENPAYRLHASASVLNWFDADAHREDCYSVADTLAEIRMHPEAGALLDAMMARASASRGDVAEAVKDNPALQRMMGRMTLISLLKQSGADGEAVKHLNRTLQTFKKI